METHGKNYEKTSLCSKKILILAIMVTSFIAYGIYSQSSREWTISVSKVSNSTLTQTIALQRNVISKILDEMSRQMAVLQCEDTKKMTMNTGAYCKRSQHKGADKKLCIALSHFLQNKSVVGFGDGTGGYKKALMKMGKVKKYDAFDGGPYSEKDSQGIVKYMDLTIPHFGLELYDWAISIEVAEHIPSKYESIFLDNIFRHAKEGIVLSWAVPGQGGLAHINNKPLQYVFRKMRENNFLVDMKLSKYLQGNCSFKHLKRTLHVYKKKLDTNNDEFRHWFV